MDKQEEQCIVFDYTSFLGASCTKTWTFVEALRALAPTLTQKLSGTEQPRMSAEERLWASALQSLSPSYSDEVNLLTLVELAKEEGIDQLKVVMPYSLEKEQIEAIQQQCQFAVTSQQQEEFILHF